MEEEEEEEEEGESYGEYIAFFHLATVHNLSSLSLHSSFLSPFLSLLPFPSPLSLGLTCLAHGGTWPA